MTLRYSLLGIPGNVNEFIEVAQRAGIREIDMSYGSELVAHTSDDGTNVERLFLDNGRRGLYRRRLTLLEYRSSTHNYGFKDHERMAEREEQRRNKVEEVVSQIRDAGLGVNVDLDDRGKGVVVLGFAPYGIVATLLLGYAVLQSVYDKF